MRTLLVCLLLVGACSPEPPFPDELTRFAELAGNPIMTWQDEAAWDAQQRERAWIVREGPSRWRMWYGAAPKGERRMRLGHARSTDGLTWIRDGDAPIVDAWTEDPMVLIHDGEYHLFAEGESDRTVHYASRDGLSWVRLGVVSVRQADGTPISPAPFGTPTVFLWDNTYYLFYERLDDGIYVATSHDLEVFTNVTDWPVIPVGPNDYDELQVALNQIIAYRGAFYAFYNGLGRRAPWTVHIARSYDLVHWHKWSGNPVLPPSLRRTSGFVVHDGERFRLYTTNGRVDAHLGLVPAPDDDSR
jgi:hypothetical protein